MKTVSAFLVAMSASVVFAAPAMLEKRCYVGPPDSDVIDTIYKQAINRGCAAKVRVCDCVGCEQ